MEIFLMALGIILSALALLCSMIIPFVIGQQFVETATGMKPTERQLMARAFVWFLWAVGIALMAIYGEWPWFN